MNNPFDSQTSEGSHEYGELQHSALLRPCPMLCDLAQRAKLRMPRLRASKIASKNATFRRSQRPAEPQEHCTTMQ